MDFTGIAGIAGMFCRSPLLTPSTPRKPMFLLLLVIILFFSDSKLTVVKSVFFVAFVVLSPIATVEGFNT